MSISITVKSLGSKVVENNNIPNMMNALIGLNVFSK